MVISLVVAAAENNAIGKDNQLLWCLPNDMRFFKNVTWGMMVVMGRKTFESLGKALKGRRNIVITKQPDWKAEGVVTVKSLDDVSLIAKEMDVKEVFVIGGGQIYKLAFPRASRIYVTRVHGSPEGGDAFFPEINEKEWVLVSNKDYEADPKHKYAYSFQVWERK